MSKEKIDDELAKKTSPAEELSNAALENVTGGRDAGSGMATGRRQYNEIVVTKDTDAASSKL